MNFFDSPFNDGNISTLDIFLCLGVALVAGILFSLLCYVKSKSSKSFLVTTSLLPTVVALIIILVNGNIGAGVAIAGAFGLVRFRSQPGSAKEICIIFIAMASGLAFGMGYLAYGAIFILACGIILLILELLHLFDKKYDCKEKIIRITIPEDLDYTEVFDEILQKYTKSYEILKVKTVNMGSMFKIYYHVVLKNSNEEKKLLDDLRIRNGNLEVSIERVEYSKSEL